MPSASAAVAASPTEVPSAPVMVVKSAVTGFGGEPAAASANKGVPGGGSPRATTHSRMLGSSGSSDTSAGNGSLPLTPAAGTVTGLGPVKNSNTLAS